MKKHDDDDDEEHSDCIGGFAYQQSPKNGQQVTPW